MKKQQTSTFTDVHPMVFISTAVLIAALILIAMYRGQIPMNLGVWMIVTDVTIAAILIAKGGKR